jgi:hypothetical protein
VRNASSAVQTQTQLPLQQSELTALVDPKEIATAYSALARRLSNGAKTFRHKVGWHGGHRHVVVRWHEQLGFWVLLNPKTDKNHFWIGFGLQNPRRHKILGITCEINPPRRGVDRRCAGIFMRNSAGSLMLGHSGKVGGGRPGIGKRAFLKGYQSKLRQVLWQDGTDTSQSEIIVIGKIGAPDFLHNLTQFIVAVDSFKLSIKENEANATKLLRAQQRKAESDGDFDPENLLDSRERLFTSIVIRRGQDVFRKKLLKEYRGRCAVTHCDCLDALEAAHIQPYLGAETNHVTNGLLLRSDVHTLFDLQKIGVADNYTVVVSKELMGSVYGRLHGKRLRLPRNAHQRPNRDVLAKHRAGMKATVP